MNSIPPNPSTPSTNTAPEYPMSQPTFRPTNLADIERVDGGRVHPEDYPPAQEQPSAAEHEAKGELVQGELAGKTMWVKPTKQWRASAFHALREGDLQGWAEATLSDDDWDTWCDIDPTLEQIEAFFQTITLGLGTNPGNSRSSRRASMRTRRR